MHIFEAGNNLSNIKSGKIDMHSGHFIKHIHDCACLAHLGIQIYGSFILGSFIQFQDKRVIQCCPNRYFIECMRYLLCFY